MGQHAAHSFLEVIYVVLLRHQLDSVQSLWNFLLVFEGLDPSSGEEREDEEEEEEDGDDCIAGVCWVRRWGEKNGERG